MIKYRVEILAVAIATAVLLFGVWAVRQIVRMPYNITITMDREVLIENGTVYWVNHRNGIACRQLPERVEDHFMIWGRRPDNLCSLALLGVRVGSLSCAFCTTGK